MDKIITLRWKLSYREIVSVLRQAVRKGDVSSTIETAIEMDLSRIGKNVFTNFFLFCAEDIGPAEPLLICEIYKQYQDWKLILINERKKESDSFRIRNARQCIISAAYSMAKARKSLVVNRAVNKFKKEVNLNFETKEEELKLFKEALQKQNINLTLEALNIIIERAESVNSRGLKEYYPVLYILNEAISTSKIAKALLDFGYCILLLPENIRSILTCMCILIVKKDYRIQHVRTMPKKEIFAVIDAWYASYRKFDSEKYHERITNKEEIENIGYPELFKEKDKEEADSPTQLGESDSPRPDYVLMDIGLQKPVKVRTISIEEDAW